MRGVSFSPFSLFAHVGVLGILHHADDLDVRLCLSGAGSAKRRPSALPSGNNTDKSLVHHGYFGGAEVVGLSELAARDERHPHGAEIAGAHAVGGNSPPHLQWAQYTLPR